MHDAFCSKENKQTQTSAYRATVITINKQHVVLIKYFSMAKSIRSKSKRKFRSEFRQTIGNDFYQKNMKQIQTKLKESVSNQTMSLESLERLSKAFDTSSSTPTTTDAETPTGVEDDPKQLKGEYVAQNTGRNKSLYKKSGKRRKKHTLKAAVSKTKTTEDTEEVNTTAAATMDGVVVEKRRPRYFVQF